MSEVPARRGRKPIEINRDEFQRYVTLLEEKHKFRSRSALWAAFAAHPWAQHRKPRALTAQVAMLYAQKNNIVVSTPKGEKGFSKDNPPPTAKSKVTQLQPPEGNEIAEVKHTKGQRLPLKVFIRRKCIDCSGGSKMEVRLCTVTKCPLYKVRPFRNKKESVNTCLTIST